MNITGLLLPLAIAPSILKFMKRTKESNVTPPTSKAGLRPICKVGEKAIFVDYKDAYVCRMDFD